MEYSPYISGKKNINLKRLHHFDTTQSMPQTAAVAPRQSKLFFLVLVKRPKEALTGTVEKKF
jgi:hypothetical protein